MRQLSICLQVLLTVVMVGFGGIARGALAQDVSEGGAYDVSWNAEGTQLAVATYRGTIIYDHNLQELHTLPTGYRTVIEWSSDSRYLLVNSEIWDMENFMLHRTLNGAAVLNVPKIWSRDGRHIVGQGLNYRDIVLLDVITGQAAQTFPVAEFELTSFDWSPDERRFATTVDRPTFRIVIINSSNGTVLLVIPQTTIIASIAWSPDGTRIAGSTTFKVEVGTPGSIPTAGSAVLASVLVWDATTGALLQSITGLPEYGRVIRWHPNGVELASAGNRGTTLIDTSTGQQIAYMVSSSVITSIDYSPYGARLAVANDPSFLRYTPPTVDQELQREQQTMRTSPEGLVDILVVDPSIERLQSIAALCDAPQAVTRALPAATDAANFDSAAFIAQLDALPADALPPGCAADLRAVAEALAGE